MTVFLFIFLLVVLCTLPVLFIWLYSKQQVSAVNTTLRYLQRVETTNVETPIPSIVTPSLKTVSLVAKK